MSRTIGQMEDDPFWFQVSLYLDQLDGLRDGYKLSKFPSIPDVGFWYFQITGDLEDLEAALGNGNVKQPAVKSDSCSALIKVLPNNEDLYVGHDTWGEYQAMLRIYKLYDLPYATSASNSESVVGSIQAFSSYPGQLYSGDDFYEISSGLVTLETTNGNYNDELFQYINPHHVLEGIRTMVANRIASNGSEWCSQFSQYNSGTYNNQWMVVDYKQIKPGEELGSDTLWALEQLPDSIHHKDVTDVLKSQGYWASYNIPYFDDIFEKSGFAKLADQFGSFFTHAGSPRAKIFARDQDKITDLKSMIHLMRYNDFKHDPLSACNCTPPYSAENAVCARSDLNDVNGTYPFFFLSHRFHGGIDTKVTSYEMFHNKLGCIAISGPTHQQQPPFQWSTSGYSNIPDGHPDLWQFEPIKISWNL
ncbi:putative phospholipase B-like 2 isoform X2 [Dysidea avara]